MNDQDKEIRWLIIKAGLQASFAMILGVILWMALTSNILRFKAPELTETQLFLCIPESVKLNFDYCIKENEIGRN